MERQFYGVAGNLEPDKPDQNKTVTPSTVEQVIRADTGYELAQVTVEAVEDLTPQIQAQEQIIAQLQTEVNGKAGLAFIAPNGIKFGAQNEIGSMFTTFPRMDTSNLTSMNKLFCNCPNLTTLDVSGWDTSKVTDMSYTFFGCRRLTSLDLSNFNTSKVTNMSNMFYNCSGLTSLDLSNFDTSNVTDMQSMFRGCSSLTSLDLSNFDFSKVTSHSNIFSSVPANCTIYVKDQAAVDILTSWDSKHTYTIKP